MDTLTHALSGALLARATEPETTNPKQLPRRVRMWVCALAAAFPDSDFVLNLIDPLTYITSHRGVTHSVIMLPLWAIALAFLFAWILRRRYSWKAFVGLCALGIGAHIAGDLITAFGTMVFAPFSFWRAQFPTTFIIDPYFSGILVAGLIASLSLPRTRLPAVVAVSGLLAYVGFQAVLHQRAAAIGDDYVAVQHLQSARAYAIPQPLSPFNWLIVVEQPQTYRLAYVSLLRDAVSAPAAPGALWFTRINASYRPPRLALWQTVPRYDARDASLAQAAWNAETLARYRRFAMFPAEYRTDRQADGACVWFNDLRFLIPERRVPFRFGVCRGGESSAWKAFLLNDGDSTEILTPIPD